MSPTEEYVILIVDDNSTNLAVISEALTNAGFEIAVATNGENAIKQSNYDPPDLILLDVDMPGIDGFETCKRLKDNPLTHQIPIIFMTALNDTSDKVKGLNLGAVDYITKPFQEAEVIARIRLHLKLSSLTKKLEEKNLQLHQLKNALEERVKERTKQLTQSLINLQQAQIQLIQSEKMSALGNLVAGIAHEINNPINSILGNVNHAEEYTKDLLQHLHLYQHHYPQPKLEIEQHGNEIDIDFLATDLPKLFYSIKLGAERVIKLSNSLRVFSRSDQENQVLANIHEAIDNTLIILQYRLKANPNRPAIQIIKNYGDIPPIKCYLGQLNQVFMNILANAIDALEESNQGRDFSEIEKFPNIITIQTELSNDRKSVVIKFKDNGIGIPEEIQSRIFDHLFTTKSSEKGTGLGLSISRQIIEEKHGGSLRCKSVLGEGTELAIAIPINM
ncbi:hybrid sensor histidine kinase/response regulator [Fischerella thermalis CCMEE 5205]|nr:hybrid sensor histidine kinase/response regulator [Fischerella thermalis CCMEE 5205]